MKLLTPDAPATKRQLWYLHILTKTDTRSLELTMAEVSGHIESVKEGLPFKPIKKADVTLPAVKQTKATFTTRVTISPKKSITKPNQFTCWYCLDGHDREELQDNPLNKWILCHGCGATTQNLDQYKTKRNKLGGAMGAVLKKATGPTGLPKNFYALRAQEGSNDDR